MGPPGFEPGATGTPNRHPSKLDYGPILLKFYGYFKKYGLSVHINYTI